MMDKTSEYKRVLSDLFSDFLSDFLSDFRLQEKLTDCAPAWEDAEARESGMIHDSWEYTHANSSS